jgi:hypothetical protein
MNGEKGTGGTRTSITQRVWVCFSKFGSTIFEAWLLFMFQAALSPSSPLNAHGIRFTLIAEYDYPTARLEAA